VRELMSMYSTWNLRSASHLSQPKGTIIAASSFHSIVFDRDMGANTSRHSWAEDLARLSDNDPDLRPISVKNYDPVPTGNENMRRLGQALLGNTVISTLSLVLQGLVLPADGEDAEDPLAAMLSVVERSTSLERLYLVVGQDTDPQVVLRFFLAVSMSNVRYLALGRYRSTIFTDQPLMTLLRNTTSLKELMLARCQLGDREADALSNNNTLTELQLAFSATDFETVLARLHRHSKLETLVIFGRREGDPGTVTSAMHHLARLPPKLKKLHLLSFDFDHADSLRPVYDGLRSSETTPRLRFSRCRFSGSAVNMLKKMLLPTTDQGSAVRSLLIKFDNGFEGYRIGELLSDVFDRNVCTKDNMKGQLKMLSILAGSDPRPTVGEDHGLEFLLHSIRRNARAVALERLLIHVDREPTYEALLQMLPAIIHLKKLTLRHYENGAGVGSLEDFLGAVKRNGSLVAVDMSGAVNWRVPRNRLTRRDYERIANTLRLCSHRNEKLPALVIKPNREDVDHDEEDEVSRTPVSCFPKLFHLANECPATGSTWIFAGLLALGDSIGPKNGGKSKR